MDTENETITLRLYEHHEVRAEVVGAPDSETETETDAHGWDYEAGDTVGVRYGHGESTTCTLVRVYSTIHTGDVRGNYRLADAEVRS